MDRLSYHPRLQTGYGPQHSLGAGPSLGARPLGGPVREANGSPTFGAYPSGINLDTSLSLLPPSVDETSLPGDFPVTIPPPWALLPPSQTPVAAWPPIPLRQPPLEAMWPPLEAPVAPLPPDVKTLTEAEPEKPPGRLARWKAKAGELLDNGWVKWGGGTFAALLSGHIGLNVVFGNHWLLGGLNNASVKERAIQKGLFASIALLSGLVGFTKGSWDLLRYSSRKAAIGLAKTAIK